MKDYRILAIITKQLKGLASAEEREELQQWEEKSAENRAASDAVRQTWDWAGKYDNGIHPDLESGLSRLQKRIARDRMTKRPSTARRRNIAWIPRLLLRSAAAVAFLLAVGFLLKNYLQPSSQPFLVSTTNGQQEKVELTDGSIVWLNQQSSLEFTNPNNREERRATLRGEAFFEVAENPEKPFIIETEDAVVQVLGTSFNVRAVPGESFTEVQVQSGKVSFKARTTGEELILEANDKGLLQHRSSKMEKMEDKTGNAIAWHSKTLRFFDTPLRRCCRTWNAITRSM